MTVVFAASLGADRRMWDRQRRAGLDGRAIDHPGHGGRPLAEVADVGNLARTVLAQVADDRFSFVGVSLGGAVGIRIALDAPERLDRLVLVSSSARFGEPAAWRERAATVREHGLEAIVDAIMERWFTPAFADVRRYREMFLATDREGYARCCDALANWDVREEIADIAAPTLVISGDEDPATPPEHGDLLVERIRGAGHVVVPDARHLVSVERAHEVNELLQRHLR